MPSLSVLSFADGGLMYALFLLPHGRSWMSAAAEAKHRSSGIETPVREKWCFERHVVTSSRSSRRCRGRCAGNTRFGGNPGQFQQIRAERPNARAVEYMFETPPACFACIGVWCRCQCRVVSTGRWKELASSLLDNQRGMIVGCVAAMHRDERMFQLRAAR